MKMKHPKPCCVKCRHAEYRVGVAYDGRPKFTCTKCDYWWTDGCDGGEYMHSKHAIWETAVKETR